MNEKSLLHFLLRALWSKIDLKSGKCYVYIGITSCDYKISQL